MADIKKFLDQSGVSTLWTRVAEEINKEAARAKAAEEAAAAAAKKAAAAKAEGDETKPASDATKLNEEK